MRVGDVRGLGDEHDVAQRHERGAKAHRRPVDGGHDRDVDVEHLVDEAASVAQRAPTGGEVAVEPLEVVDVATGAERSAVAGDDGRPDIVVALDLPPQRRHAVVQVVVEGVHLVRTVEADDQHRAVGGDLEGVGQVVGHQTRSMIVAVPMPPPVHIVISAVVRSRRSSSSRAVWISMPPVAPIGWPRAIAPPLTLTFSGSRSRSRIVFRGTAAKASLISHRSMSSTFMPARSRHFCDAGPGAVSMITGSAPATALITIRARGVQAVGPGVVGRGQQHGAGPVDDARRVAGVVHVLDGLDLRVRLPAHLVEASARSPGTRSRPISSNDGVSLASPSSVRAGPGELVAIEGDGAVRVRGSAPRCGRSGLRPWPWRPAAGCASGERIDVVAVEALDRGDQVGRDALGHEREPLAQRGVAGREVDGAVLGRPARHHLHAAADDEVLVAGLDAHRGERDRLLAGAAEAVERDARRLDRPAGGEHGHPADAHRRGRRPGCRCR